MKRVIRDGRIGKIVNVIQIADGIGQMYELSFEGQLCTECFWDSEVEDI